MTVLARLARLLFLACLGLAPSGLTADTLRVAVASNFKPAMEVLAQKFQDETGYALSLSYGSTGKHYAQIINGAPFAVFLAADVERPLRLEKAGIARPGSRFTYAVGKLVLWSAHGDIGNGEQVLREGRFRFIAIANPSTAPYGLAAQQVLSRLDLWDALESRIVRGENIGQAYAFVRSGNADYAFLAWSQIKPRQDLGGSVWQVPEHLYDPIEQQAVLLDDSEAAQALRAFLRDEPAVSVIRDHGYTVP